MMGTTTPRRLMTPNNQAGVCGTLVTWLQPRISCTERMPTPYSSPASLKVRNCWASAASSAPLHS